MKLKCDVNLPASKSESNRAMMIAAYGGFVPDFQNLSESNDTQLLKHILLSIDTLAPFVARYDMDSNMGISRHVIPNRQVSVSMPKNSPTEIDIVDCGTAARFLTTYLACTDGDWLLTGSDRMKQRPIHPLVDALIQLGAEIQYVERKGFLPLRIVSKPIKGGKVQIDATQSSQFASSLLLAAPTWSQGLELELVGSPSSMPYLDMTLAMMRQFGAEVLRSGRTIIVGPKPYQPNSFSVSADWTAASYWYEIAAFCEECEIILRGLSTGSKIVQGDAVIAEWMQSFGVKTEQLEDGILLTKTTFEKKPLKFDFADHPDLYPTMAATCIGLGIEVEFQGVDNLRFKESDRVEAMRTELAKIGQKPLRFCAHNDHRIVMALAPLSMLFGPSSFDHPEVVEKSYPNFWNDADFLRF